MTDAIEILKLIPSILNGIAALIKVIKPTGVVARRRGKIGLTASMRFGPAAGQAHAPYRRHHLSGPEQPGRRGDRH